MPIYVYETIPQKAGEEPRRFELKQSMNDAPLARLGVGIGIITQHAAPPPPQGCCGGMGGGCCAGQCACAE